MNNKKPNRLVNEKSPYLLQHAYNPVDWFAWSDEAFEEAKKQDKPIFLSIGYSTCHWCHVMERESFEDSEVAELMNEAFISIKVDREERPDIDNIYMLVCQMMTGHGGWPLSVIMDHNKKPFFTGTYFPKESRYGRIGFIDLIKQIRDAWKNRRNEIFNSAQSITDHLQQYSNNRSMQEIDATIMTKAFTEFNKKFDQDYGGFGKAPKFPSPHNLLFLLSYYKNTNEEKALEMVERTLIEMRKGGVYDHIGFGFHRYSTDQKWLLPHFEKMLYDQAMLLLAYSELYSITQNSFIKKTANEIIEYVLRDLTYKEGGFFSAEDADSEGVEGKFYVWSETELKSIFNVHEFNLIKSVFNTYPDGNFSEESTREFTGENILHLQKDFKQLSKELNISQDKLEEKLEKIRKILFSIREKRIHPYKDDKILTDWNGLFIAALASAGRKLYNHEAIISAEKAVSFIYSKMFDNNGKLLHRFRENESAINANVDDYAFLIFGLIELYKSTFRFEYLLKAIELQHKQDEIFWDAESGCYFFSENKKDLLTRTREIYDSAIPSGNSVSLINLISLSKFLADDDFSKKADQLFIAYGETVNKVPSGFGMFLLGADLLLNGSRELVIVSKTKEELKSAIDCIDINKHNLFIIAIVEDELETLSKTMKWIEGYKTINGKNTFYLCSNFTCEKPVNNIEELNF